MPIPSRESEMAKPTLIFNVQPLGPENTAEQQRIRRAVNRVHEAVSDAEPEWLTRALADRAIEAAEKFEGMDHQNPEWAREAMLGNAYCARFVAFRNSSDYEAALNHQRRAVTCARTDRQRAKSYTNICDYALRADDADLAVEAGRQAVALWPDDHGIIINLAMACYARGLKGHASEVLEKLLALSGANEETVLGAYAEFEGYFLVMHDLPIVGKLREIAQRKARREVPA